MIHVKGLCLSIVGGIQPGKIARYVYEATEGGVEDDGLLQRFQLLVWPASGQPFENVDRYPYKQERDRAYRIYERLIDLDTDTLGATKAEYQEIAALRFSPEAQAFFDDWRLDLETRLRSGTINSQAFESHLAKYRSLMPSLALLLHLVRKVEGWEGETVPLDIAKQAAAWCEFLELHAKKVYAGVLNRDLQAAHALAAKIAEGAISDDQAPRDILRAQWSLLHESEDVYGGLRRLETAGWIRFEEKPTTTRGGRPTTRIRLHPELRARQGDVLG
jgi:hypothetical protein